MTDRKKKRGRPAKTKGLTIKQEKFVRAVMDGNMSPPKAVVEAGYNVKNKNSAEALGYRMINHNPKIQKAITDVFAEKYPDTGADAARVLTDIMNNEMESSMARMKAIEMISKFFGWQAPSKHQHLSAKVDVSKYKLPEDK